MANNKLTFQEQEILKNISKWRGVELDQVEYIFNEVNKSFMKTIKVIDMYYELGISIAKSIKNVMKL